MIHVVIGQSGAGKTTFVKNTFLQGGLEIIDGIVPVTTNGEFYAIGKYGIGIRTEGTDRLHLSSHKDIRSRVVELISEGKKVVLEGDRITGDNMFLFFSKLKVKKHLYLLECPLEVSIQRLNIEGITSSYSFLKATKTKSKRVYLSWQKFFDTSKVIKTW